MDERLRDRLDDVMDETQALLAYSQWLRDYSHQLREDCARLRMASRQLTDPSQRPRTSIFPFNLTDERRAS